MMTGIDCLSEQLQTSVRAGPKIRAGGRPQTERCALESVLNCRFRRRSESVTSAEVHVRVGRHLQLKYAQFKFKKYLAFSRKIREFSRKIKLYYENSASCKLHWATPPLTRMPARGVISRRPCRSCSPPREASLSDEVRAHPKRYAMS
jgi:hypothetical protein